MNKLNKTILAYFIICLPVATIVYLFFPSIRDTDTSRGSSLREWSNAIYGFLFAVWIICASYIGIALVLSKKFREQLLTRISGMKERDEREEFIVGKSSRNAFLFNLGLLILLFMLNLFQINVTKLPPDKVFDGKKHSLSLGLKLSPLEQLGTEKKQSQNGNAQDASTLFNYSLPITVSGVLLLLIVSQIGSFYVYSRRYYNTYQKNN